MRTPPSHERLLARLIADAHPVRPLWAPHSRLALWLALQTLTLGVAVTVGLRPNLGDHLRRPLFLLELGALIAAGVTAAALALRAAVPGMAGGRVGLTCSVLLGTVALLAHEPAASVHSLQGFVANGTQCVICMLAFSALPWTALFVAVRRGAPLNGPGAGAYTGAAAFLFAAAAVRIACPIDEELHLLAWHVVPIAMGTALSAVAGARWLERWDHA